MHILRVSAVQMYVRDCVSDNLSAILSAVRTAAEEGADILLTPEGSLSGYRSGFNRAEVCEALREVTAAARESRTGLALGTCFEEEDGLCYNQLRFYDKQGAYLGFHSKTLTCGTLEDPPRGEIEEYAVRPLRTFDFHGIQVGGLICNDLWANPGCTPQPDPHLVTMLAKMGARVIFHAVNGGRDGSEFSNVVCRGYHESNLALRALAAGVWIVTVDNAWPGDIPNACSGGVMTPRGTWAVKMQTMGEDRFAYTIKL